jgi:hypothetical protein
MLGPALLPVPLRSRLLPGTTVTNRATSCVTRRPPQPWLSARQPAAAVIMFYKSDFFPIFKLFLLFFSFLEFIIMLYSISIIFYKSDFFPIFKLFLLFFSFLEFIITLYSISIIFLSDFFPIFIIIFIIFVYWNLLLRYTVFQLYFLK